MNRKKVIWLVLFILIVKCLTETGEPVGDACPHVMAQPGTSLKLFYQHTEGEDKVCCGCNPGTYMEQPCRSSVEHTTTVCKPCPAGTYMLKHAHHNPKCVEDDLVCPAGMIKIPPQRDKAPRCDCSEGFFKSRTGACFPFTLCPPGEGVKTLPTPFRDTVCEKCPYGYYSPNNSFFEGCFLLPSILAFDANKLPKASLFSFVYNLPTSNETIQSTTVENQLINAAQQNHALIIVAICVLVFLFLGYLFYKWIMERRKQKKLLHINRSSSHNDEIVSFRHGLQPHGSEAGGSRRECKKMNQLKNDLSCCMSIDDAKMMFRFLTERYHNSEAILINLISVHYLNQAREIIFSIFYRLSNLLGEDLTPQLLHDCFVRRMNNRSLADEVEKIFPEIVDDAEMV